MTLSAIQWDMILGGFGLFMFGIDFMGSGIRAYAGDRLRDYIQKYTARRWQAVLIGILMTIMMQSSSASTAITISFVRAGLMTMNQAAGVIMGANIGRTITPFLVSMNIDAYALYIVFVGCMFLLFGKKHRTHDLGQIITGFGLIFYGLSAMGSSMAELKDLPEFSAFALKMAGNPVLSMLTGVVMTALIQSSAASISVIQKMYASGALSFQAVLPFMFGADIGTTVTGILAAMGGSLGARRTAAIHTVFNVLVSVVFMCLLHPYSILMENLCELLHLEPMMEVAVANIIFNIIGVLMVMPFLDQLCALVCRIVPGREPARMSVNIEDLDQDTSRMIPSAALEIAARAMDQMAAVVRQTIKQTQEFLNKPGTAEDQDLLKQNEDLIDRMDYKITNFLVQLSTRPDVTPDDTLQIRCSMETIKNMERIGDLLENVTEFLAMIHDDNGSFTENAARDLNDMFQLVSSMFDNAYAIVRLSDTASLDQLLKDEDSLDQLEYRSRQDHFDRLARNACPSPVAGSVYCDILGNLERMGDHCCNIAKSLQPYRFEQFGNP